MISERRIRLKSELILQKTCHQFALLQLVSVIVNVVPKNEFAETGVITEAEEEINQVKSYISKINLITNNTPKDRPETEIAEDG